MKFVASVNAFRKLFLMLVFVCAFCSVGAEKWPDGTKINKWFYKLNYSINNKESKQFNILEYGAQNDSTLLQTKLIQKVIDEAHAAGGGTVVIPKGTWLTSSLFFKPHTHLYLERGAVLKGSNNIDDYPWRDVHIEGVIQPYVAALINAYGVNGFSITGEGTINGNGVTFWNSFWQRRKQNRACTNLEVHRPRLIYVCNSNDVHIEGVKLLNAGFWTTHLYKCKRVRMRDVTIFAPYAPVKAPSTDGVDIDGCDMVHIMCCNIACGDDLISLKGGKGSWADKDKNNGVNMHIIIEHCNMGHGSGALVFGSECVNAKNVIFRFSEVHGTDRLLWLKMRPDTPQRYEYIDINNILKGEVGTVLYVKPWTQFFDLKGRRDIPKSYGSHIRLKHCFLNCKHVKDVVEDSTQFELNDIKFEFNKFYVNSKIPVNYDKSKIGNYTPADVLKFANGKPVKTITQWRKRRGEILDIFQKEMYGMMPPKHAFTLETLERGETLGGKAIRKQVRMWFDEQKKGPFIDWLMVYPNNACKQIPAILTLNYYGNHTMLTDKEIGITQNWLENSAKYGVENNHATERSRGIFADTSRISCFPIQYLIENGYAFVTACYGDVSPDPDAYHPLDYHPSYFASSPQDSIAYTGCYDLWEEMSTATDRKIYALMAWAWALREGMDMLEMDDRIASEKVVLTGSSRLGKAALLAAAYDERFQYTVLNQTGGGGVPLAHRNYGENVATEMLMFSHWYHPNYGKYAQNEEAMPFDQHMLLACIAPRKLLVEGFDNKWFDAEGEFQSLQYASKAWEFLGKEGLPAVSIPAYNQTHAIGKDLGYVRRKGAHGFSMKDWHWMLGK